MTLPAYQVGFLTVAPLLHGVAVMRTLPPPWQPHVYQGAVYRVVDATGAQVGSIIEPINGHIDAEGFSWDCGSLDVARDGFINGADFDLFVAWFEAGSVLADFNCDGFVNGVDYDDFVTAFVAGQ